MAAFITIPRDRIQKFIKQCHLHTHPPKNSEILIHAAVWMNLDRKKPAQKAPSSLTRV